jgi:phage terminase large subunit-like protein
MVWQTDEYYQSERSVLIDSEFRRIHRNEWVSSEETMVPMDKWDSLEKRLPPIGKDEPIVIGIDLSVSGDCTALVVVSKHLDGSIAGIKLGPPGTIALRQVHKWDAPKGSKIDYGVTLKPVLYNLLRNFHVVAVAYDEYQAHDLVTEARRQGLGWFTQVQQGKGSYAHPGRPVMDKAFYDKVIAGTLVHDGDPDLRHHVQNAAGKSTEEKYLRFVKKSESAKIDLLIASTMAVGTIDRLNVFSRD